MTALVERDKKRRKLVDKYELTRIELKNIIKSTSLPIKVRWEANLKLAKLPSDSSKVRIRNRCVITGRTRGIYRDFKMSRIVFRQLASNGELPGVRKSSW